MNRSNVGNIVTNAVQIGSVGATTYAGFERSARRARKEDAASAFNYLSKEELQQIGQSKAQRMKDEANRYSAGGSSPFQHLSDEESSKFQEKKAEGMREFISEGDDESEGVDVEEVMSGLESEESDRIKAKTSFDVSFFEELARTSREE